MKITVERAALLRSLGHVQNVVERRNTIPILSNVLFDASDGQSFRIIATDLDMAISERVPDASVSQGGTITVSAHLLHDIARKLPDGAQVALALTDGRLSIRAGRSRFTLPTIQADDFPTMVTEPFTTRFSLTAQTLARIIDATRFAMSTEETRYYLNGIFWHIVGDELRCAATDGHRLARYVLAAPDGASDMDDAILPRKAVGELRKLLDECGKDAIIGVELSKTKARFTIGGANGVVITTKLIDGTFPDYNRVIPTGNQQIVVLDPAALAQGVDRVATVASDKTRAVKLSVSQDKVTLSVVSPDNGTASEELPADYDGSDFDVGFNSAYLRDVLAQIDGDSVELHLNGSDGPALVRHKADSAALFIVMPMRVN